MKATELLRTQQRLLIKQLFYEIENNNIKKIKEILSKNPNPIDFTYESRMLDPGDFRTIYSAISRSLLYHAAIYGNPLIVEALLDAGADINQQNILNKKTPLHGAVYFNRKEVINLLLTREADTKIKDRYGKTPFIEEEKPSYILSNNSCSIIEKEGCKASLSVET